MPCFGNDQLEPVCSTHSTAPSHRQRSITVGICMLADCSRRLATPSYHVSACNSVSLDLRRSTTFGPGTRVGMCDERLSRRCVSLLNVLSKKLPDASVKSRVGDGRRPSPASPSLALHLHVHGASTPTCPGGQPGVIVWSVPVQCHVTSMVPSFPGGQSISPTSRVAGVVMGRRDTHPGTCAVMPEVGEIESRAGPHAQQTVTCMPLRKQRSAPPPNTRPVIISVLAPTSSPSYFETAPLAAAVSYPLRGLPLVPALFADCRSASSLPGLHIFCCSGSTSYASPSLRTRSAKNEEKSPSSRLSSSCGRPCVVAARRRCFPDRGEEPLSRAPWRPHIRRRSSPAYPHMAIIHAFSPASRVHGNRVARSRK